MGWCFCFECLPSLKLTWHLKMDGWDTCFLLGWRFGEGDCQFRINDRYLKHQLENWNNYSGCFKFLPEPIKLRHLNLVATDVWFHCLVCLKEGKSVVISFTEVVFNKLIAGSCVEYIVCFYVPFNWDLGESPSWRVFLQIKLKNAFDHLEA